MDLVTSAQYQTLKESFPRDGGAAIEAEYTPAGDIDYMYGVDQLLTVDDSAYIDQLGRELPELRVDERAPRAGGLVTLNIDRVRDRDGSMTVPEAMRLLEERLGDGLRDTEGRLRLAEGDEGTRPEIPPPLVTPNYVNHITKICPAGEPEVPSGYPTRPWPPQVSGSGGNGVRLLVVDTGLLENLDFNRYDWLDGVTGEPDELGPILPGGQLHIPQYAGHGTFVAGMARCMAPAAEVFVGDHFTASGGELENVIIAKLEELVQEWEPNIVCLPAGTYTRRNWGSLGFSQFHRNHPKIVLVASAGNDSTDRPFYPAAFTWVVGVGALGTDQQHRAWFSNFGASSDVYALGEGTVNAYATGLYTYREPPKRPAQQTFDGMARWDGTSYSAPLVAGLIAVEMSSSASSAEVAKDAVLGRATDLPGVGPALTLPL
jgi:hypothetical protein